MKPSPDIFRRTWQALRRLDGCEKLFFILAALQAGVIWLHRSFPTQDGPMQIYLADVLEDLARGAGAYSSYFQSQGYGHPYSFCIYALMSLNQVFQPLTSERILVCLYFVAFSLGVRFLVRAIDTENHWLPLFLMPFALNAYLCLGIYNFSCAIALLTFMLGLWLRWSGAWNATRSLLWLALLMLLGWMHHVPLGILGLFIGMHAAATAVLCLGSFPDATMAARVRLVWRRMRWDLANALLLLAPLGWYMIFAGAAVRGEAVTVPLVEMTWGDRIRGLMQMLPLSPYFGSGYCFCLLLLVLVPVALYCLRPPGVSFAAKTAAAACFALSVTALACLAVYIFGPHFLFGHGHGYFAERMAVPFVICGLAALAPLRLPTPLRGIATALVAALFLFMLCVEERQTAAVVAELAPLYDARPANRGLSGAIISGMEPMEGLNFNPYYWVGALYAQKGKGVLLNLSGGYEPIALFGSRRAHPWDDSTPQRIREILLDTRVDVSPQLAFLCGGKWDSARTEMEPASILARRRGLTPVLDSHVFYCYGRGSDPSLTQAQTEALR